MIAVTEARFNQLNARNRAEWYQITLADAMSHPEVDDAQKKTLKAQLLVLQDFKRHRFGILPS